MLGHLEPAGLHALHHFDQPDLDGVAALAFLLRWVRIPVWRVRGLLLEHLHAQVAVLLGQGLAAALVVLQAIVRPRDRDPVAARLDGQAVHSGRGLAQPVGVVDVHHVVVGVVCQPDRGRGVVPAKIKAADATPVRQDLHLRFPHSLVRQREDAAAAQRRRAVDARLALVARVAGDDGQALLGRVVLGIVDGHVDHGRAGWFLLKESTDHFGHSLQRGKGQRHHAPAGVGSRQAFKVDVFGRLFVEPDPIQRLALPAQPALVVGLDRHPAGVGLDVTAAAVLDEDRLHKVRHATDGALDFPDGFTRYRPGAPAAHLTQQDPLHGVARRLARLAGGPANRGLVERRAGPPVRVAAGQVHRVLEAGAPGVVVHHSSRDVVFQPRHSEVVHCFAGNRLICYNPIPFAEWSQQCRANPLIPSSFAN